MDTAEDAVEAGWWPDFWHGGINCQGPVCAACTKAHLMFDANGEADLKAGSALPELAIPLFKRPNMR
jgi:hypothetical protein